MINVIAHYLDERPDLNKDDAFALMCLADWADEDGECFPGMTAFARRLRIEKRSATAAVKRLEERGEVLIVPGAGKTTQGGRTSLYVLLSYRRKIGKAIPESWFKQSEEKRNRDSENGKKSKTPPPKRGANKPRRGATEREGVQPNVTKGVQPNAPKPSLLEPSEEPSLQPAAPDGKDDSLQSKVFDVLESQYLTVNPLMVQTHTELAERYGFDAFLRGWEYCKPGTRHKASYLEKVILSHMTDDETPDELKAKESPRRIWCKHSTDFNASGWITVEGDRIKYEAKDSTTYTTQHPQWLKKVQAGEINDNLLGLFYTRGKAA